ncbi:transglycosylase SLT domain-containing protein [Streptomyces sp. NBC_00344]|uniref:transglycosylase SLT domain-containing protein n=1 Tax=Streptomyces sp. NBC_00344 TaxID=2975720 RepID=UPI002E1D5B3D
MLRFTTLRTGRSRKIATAVLVAAGASTAVAATAGTSSAQTPAAHAPATIKPVTANGLPITVKPAAKAPAKDAAKTDKIVDTAAVSHHIELTATAQAHAAKQAAAKQAAAKKAAAKHAAAKQAANRSTHRATLAPKQYPNNLNGWIHESLAIMKAKGIPGTYEGLHRNIMRESGGDPNAVNDWDINAINGVPSKGLLQVIQPTFDTYHVAGTANKLTDPVANLTAAANYAADRYGSIDNVNSAY